MPILEADELSELQADLAETFLETMPDVGEYTYGESRERNPNAPDEFVVTAGLTIGNIPCSYRVSNGRERVIADNPKGLDLLTVIVPATFRFKKGGRFRILAKGDEVEKRLNILTVLTKSNMLKLSFVGEMVETVPDN